MPEALLARYGFVPPEPWPQALAAGWLNPQHSDHLRLSDLLWLDADRIANWQFPNDQIEGLIPFAHTTGLDLWCWAPLLGDAEAPTPIVFCPDDDEVAHCFAPDFPAFLYRRLLEEYACLGPGEYLPAAAASRDLRAYTRRLAPWLTPAWQNRLDALAQRPWREDSQGYRGVIDANELDSILNEDLPWPRRDEEFEHYRMN